MPRKVFQPAACILIPYYWVPNPILVKWKPEPDMNIELQTN